MLTCEVNAHELLNLQTRMDLAELDGYLQDLQQAHALIAECRRMRVVLLGGIVRGERTLDGEDQEEKLQLVERHIVKTIKTIFDLEYILRVDFGL